MIIKQSNLLSALTHLRAALSTLAPKEELNGEQMYIREQLEEALTLLNEANEPEEELNELTPEELLDGIKSDIHEFSESIKPRVWDLCDRLKYTDSSRISYIIDHVSVLDERVLEYAILGR